MPPWILPWRHVIRDTFLFIGKDQFSSSAFPINLDRFYEHFKFMIHCEICNFRFCKHVMSSLSMNERVGLHGSQIVLIGWTPHCPDTGSTGGMNRTPLLIPRRTPLLGDGGWCCNHCSHHRVVELPTAARHPGLAIQLCHCVTRSRRTLVVGLRSRTDGSARCCSLSLLPCER